MKQLRIIGASVIAVAVCLAFAGAASASPTLTSPSGTTFFGTLTMTATSSVLWKATAGNVTCTGSTSSMKVVSNNESSASGQTSTWTFSGCSGTVHVLTLGATIFHHNTGTVTEKEAEVTLSFFGVSCVFGGGTVDIGRMEGGTPAKVTVNATLPLVSGSSFVCGSTASWSGGYTVTTPSTLFIA